MTGKGIPPPVEKIMSDLEGHRDPATLRNLAEKEAKQVELYEVETLSTEEVSEMLHDLRVHEAELTIQNEELRNAHEELDASRERYRELYDLAPVGYCTVSEAGLILEANLTLANLLGTTRSSLVNSMFTKFVARDDQDYYYYYYRKVFFESDEPQDAELRMKKEGDEPVWVHITGTRSGDKEAEYICRMAISDITARKKAEEELEKYRESLEELVKERTEELQSVNTRLSAEVRDRKRAEKGLKESQSRLEAVFSAIPDPVIQFGADGRVVRANKVALESLGYSSLNFTKDQAVAKLRFRRPDGAPVESQDLALSRALKGEAVVDDVYSITSVDGTERMVSVYAVPLFEKGAISGALVLRHDITEMKKAEDALQKAHDELDVRVRERTSELLGAYVKLKAEVEERERLESELRQAHKMEALGTLTGGIAHDFNNILAAIIGYTEMTLDDAEEGSRASHNLQRVLTSAVRARDLIRQMLAFSRKTGTEKMPLPLVPLVKETVQLLRALIPTSIRIDVKTTATSDTVLANVTGVQQIVMNLCSNAAYAMREKGGKLTVTLEDAVTAPAGLPEREYLALEVADTGTGMEADLFKKIFEPFFTTKDVGEGTGMGLSVVYGIVKSLDGDVTVESVPGQGSTFRVFLPKTAIKKERPARGAEKTPEGTERILFVDDEEILAELGTDLLGKLGYHVTAISDSEEALKLFSENPSGFDLVITDHTMPKFTGLRLAEELLKIRPDTPILLCTGHSDRVDPETAKVAGIKEFLMKPLAGQELARAVRRALNSRPEADLREGEAEKGTVTTRQRRRKVHELSVKETS